MIRHYLHTAIRNAVAHKRDSALTILGLAIGFACAILVLLFLRYELSYDKWIPDSSDLHRFEISLLPPDAPPIEATTSPFPLAPAVESRLPEVTAAVHIVPQESTIVVDNRKFPQRANIVSSNFFSVIRLPFVTGDASKAMSKPNSAVVTERLGTKLFPGTSPVGKTIILNGEHVLRVEAVLRDLPENTHLVGDLFIPETSSAFTARDDAQEDWQTFRGWTYLRTRAGIDIHSIEAQIRDLYAQRSPALLAAYRLPAERLIKVDLRPFTDIHLAGSRRDGMKPGRSWTTVHAFGIVAVLIIVMACFNFINLATARSALRAREVSMRRVLGASRKQIVVQFLFESMLTSVVALLLAIIAARLLLANGIAPAELPSQVQWPSILLLTAIALAIGAMAGFYPAVVVSRFRPAAVLRANTSGDTGSGTFRSILVVLQFAVAIGLGIVAIVIFSQVRHVRSVDLGFDSTNLVVLEAGEERPLSDRSAESLAHVLARDPSILGVARSDTVPFGKDETRSSAEMHGLAQPITVRTVNISPDYPLVYRTKLLSGRFLSAKRSDDHVAARAQGEGLSRGRNVLIDENAARAFGLTPHDAIGKSFSIGPVRDLTIVGVVENAILQLDPVGTVYFSNERGLLQLAVRLKEGSVPEGLAAINRAWSAFSPDHAQRRYFIDERYSSLFNDSAREGRVFATFVAVAMFIACFGMFGLSAFAVARRTREIGLRKVFGARTGDIIRLLLWHATKPIILASIVAWPVAVYYLSGWLSGFSERIALSPIPFMVASLTALVLAWLTIVGHAVHVAHRSPVYALRYE